MIFEGKKMLQRVNSVIYFLAVEAMFKVNYRGERNRIVNSGFPNNKSFFP